MAVDKLPEFAKNGQKNTDNLVQEDGFPVNLKPARQWFNFLFNKLTLSINQIIDENFIKHDELIDNLTTNDATKPLTAKQGKVLQDNKLDKTENAVSATKLLTARTVQFSGAATGSFIYNGSANSSCILTLANSGVVAGSYASTIKIPQITVNAKGQLTAISQQDIRSASTTQSGVVQLADDLITDDATKSLTAKQGKVLQDSKLDKNGIAQKSIVIQTTDNRNIQPKNIPHGVNSYFVNTSGLLNGGNNADYGDFLAFNGYSDSSGGYKNGLFLGKTGEGILHYQALYNAEVWGAPRQIAYTNSETFSGDTNFGSITASGDIKTSLWSYASRFIGPLNGNADTATKLATARSIAVTGAVSGSANFDGSGNIVISTSANTDNLRVVNGSGYTITFDDHRRIAIIQMTLWTNKTVPSQTLAESVGSNRHQIYSLPILLKARISADIRLSEEGTPSTYVQEAFEWLSNIMQDGYRGYSANSNLFARFRRWSVGSNETVSAVATIVGIF